MSLTNVFTAVFLSVTLSGSMMSEANPIPLNNEAAYCSYKRLISQSNLTWEQVHKLCDNFKSNRNLEYVLPVTVTNLLSTEAMTIEIRFALEEIDWLSKHQEYLLHYGVIIDYLLADEANTTSATDFLSEMTEVRRLIAVTIADLEDTMIKVGVAPLSISSLSEEASPRFETQWEQDDTARYQRDLYVLAEMKHHFGKAYNDFSYMKSQSHPTAGSNAPTCL